MFNYSFIALLILVILSACVNPQYSRYAANSNQINYIPMYGEPEKKKTEAQKEADAKFVETVIKNSGSREKAAREFSLWGWSEKRKGNNKKAISRFNQSWLIDPNYYMVYWGFGSISLTERELSKAAEYFDKALSLIDNEDKEKSRLQVDAARVYAWRASELKESNNEKSGVFYNKANSLINGAFVSNPKYSKAYSLGAFIAYDQGDYKRAWDIVKKSRDAGSYKFDDKFIAKLSKKMVEP